MAGTDRQRAGDVSGLWHEPGTLVEHFRTAGLVAYVKLLLRGRRLRMPSGDVSQLGGDVIIDPEGIIRLHHVGAGPGDRPAIHGLLDAVRRARHRANKATESP